MNPHLLWTFHLGPIHHELSISAMHQDMHLLPSPLSIVTTSTWVTQQSLHHSLTFIPSPSTSIIHFNHNLSDRGGLRLQDNRQTGNSPFNQPPTSMVWPLWA
ncbi:hypothetical protein N7465_001468 [Penicillium sp. CMV-2018d]|nr:hypothetical protein N7465_001468 [Penicillium sp. CMV-2018d]